MRGPTPSLMLAAVIGVSLLTIRVTAAATEPAEGNLKAAAQELARQYDENYNAKNAAGMAALYAADGTLVTPGPVVTGHDALQKYYQSRFDAGATDHHMTVKSVQTLGDSGYGVGEVHVKAPFDGKMTEMHGHVVWL